jgi:hypothetical protein
MSINGVNNPLLTSIGPLNRPSDPSRTLPNGVPGRATDVATGAALRPALKPQVPIAGQAALQSTVPAEAPAGTDPSLWSVLTSDERNFFAKTASLGPLTYGRIKASTAAAPPSVRGGRLDVRA